MAAASATFQSRPGSESRRNSALESKALAMLGPRDHALRRTLNLASLADRGVFFRGYQAIAVNPEGGWIGASESRKDGQAAGY